MEDKKYNPFVVKHMAKPKPQPKPNPLPKVNTKPKPKTEPKARGLTLENKKKLDIIFAKGFV